MKSLGGVGDLHCEKLRGLRIVRGDDALQHHVPHEIFFIAGDLQRKCRVATLLGGG